MCGNREYFVFHIRVKTDESPLNFRVPPPCSGSTIIIIIIIVLPPAEVSAAAAAAAAAGGLQAAMGPQPSGRTSAEEEEEEDRDCEGKGHTHGAFKDSGDYSIWGLSCVTEGTATLLSSERCLPRVHPMKVTRWCSESALNGWNTPPSSQPPCLPVSQTFGPESVDVRFLTLKKESLTNRGESVLLPLNTFLNTSINT